MSRNKRMVSLLGFDRNFTGMFASYCHLLKSHLNDNWILNREDESSEIVVVSDKYKGAISKKSKVTIIIGDSETLKSFDNKEMKHELFKISYPISSAKILDVLNKVSKLKCIQKNSLTKFKQEFSFKNMFSRFMKNHKQKNVVKQNNSNNKTNKVANKLLSILQPDISKNLKVVFLGRPGSGKTTAITSVSTSKALTSEVNTTDSVGLIKKQTTIGIDYGECDFENGVKLRLYGTPGQRRYDYVQTQTVSSANIYVILVDLSSVAPFAEFMYYKDILNTAGNKNALRVVAFTHYDLKEHNMSQLSKEIRRKCHGEILSVKVDTRVSDEVRFMLEKAAEMKLGSVPVHEYYAENSLFLKNINA